MSMHPTSVAVVPDLFSEWERDRYAIFGSELSYFTRKLHIALVWSPGICFDWFDMRAPLREDIKKRSGSHQMPILLTPENWMLADTTPILHLLDTRIKSTTGNLFFPAGITGAIVYMLEEFFDLWMSHSAVYFRWCYPECVAHARPILAKAMSDPKASYESIESLEGTIEAWGGKAVRALGLSSKENQERTREEFLEIFELLDKHLEQLYESPTKISGQCVFILGIGAPCALDAVLLGGIWAHFYQDPVPRAIIQSRFSYVSKWTTENYYLAKSGQFPQWPAHHEIDAHNLPTFFRGIFKIMGDRFLPWLNANGTALKNKETQFELDINRTGTKVSYLTRPYPEKSRRMLSRWVETHLIPRHKVELQNLLRTYHLNDFIITMPYQSHL